MDGERNQSDKAGAGRRAWLALGVLGLVLVVFGVARFSGLIETEHLGERLSETLSEVSGTPLAPLLLGGIFCLGALLAAPQFLLLGIGVLAFGPVWGAVWGWAATLMSGALTYGLGWVSGQGLLQRLTNRRLKRLISFISKNALAASTIVRNVPAGPFLMVNMVFGAMRAPFLAYLTGLAFGSLPKILLVAFGAQAIQSALGGRTVLAALAALSAVAIFVAGALFVRPRRRKGEILSGDDAQTVDTAR